MRNRTGVVPGLVGLIAALSTGGDGTHAQPSTTDVRVLQPATGTAPASEAAKPRALRKSTGDARLRVTGKARVVDAHTLAFEDGTEVDINGLMDAPDLEQKVLIDGSLRPLGKEAAEFLRRLIGNQTVTFLAFGDRNGTEKRPFGNCYAGETLIQEAMVRNGWAVSDHSATELAELIAQENKRGLWRGQFIPPNRWRKGERLPGE